MLEKLMMKLNSEFNLIEKLELLEHIEFLLYGEDELTIYPIYESDSEIKENELSIEKYLSRLYQNDELDDFEEQNFIDILRRLTCTYESKNDELSQMKFYLKLFDYFNS